MSDGVKADVGCVTVRNVNDSTCAWGIGNKCVVPNGDVIAVDFNGAIGTVAGIGICLAKVAVLDGDVVDCTSCCEVDAVAGA